MRTLSITGAVLAIMLFVAACSEDKKLEIYPVDEDVVLKDAAYGNHARHRMDIYLPAGRTPGATKIVVFVHGGGWAGGDKDDLPLTDESIQVLKENFPGFALFNLNYRLVSGSDNQYPAAEDDVKQALEYIYRKLESYQLSSDTYMIGGSAGAHLAALNTLKYNNDGRIKGCIAISGVYNMVSLYDTGNSEAKMFVASFMGGTPEERTQEYEQASPINFVTPSSAKFLILHGLEDGLVPVSQAYELRDALMQENVDHTVFTYPGGHGIPPEHLVEAFGYITAFLR